MKRNRVWICALVGMFGAACGDDRGGDGTTTVSSAICAPTFPNGGMGSMWSGGVVRYQWAAGLPQDRKNLALAAMSEWTTDTDGAITFVESPGSGDRYVLFTNDPWCAGSGPGFVGFGLGGCPTLPLTGQVRHEFGHLIGFDHEQQRSDRDRHLQLMDVSLFGCNAGPSLIGDDVYTKVAPNSPWPAGGIGPGSTLGRFDYQSVMLYAFLQASNPSPFNCLLPLPGGGGGDPRRSFVKRGVTTAGTPPCPADVADSYNVITSHDRASAVEAYSTQKLWSPGQSMAADVGSQTALDFKLASGVYAVGNPGVAALGHIFRSAVTRGSDGNVYISSQVPGSSWTNLGHPGVSLSGDPAIVSWSQSSVRVDVAIIAADAGGTKRVYKRAANNGVWEPAWVLLPGTQPTGLGGGITMASWGANRLDLFVNAGAKIWHQSWDGSNWSAWVNPGGDVPGGGPGTPAAVSWGFNRIDVVVRAADNMVKQLVWDNGWAPWVNVKNVSSMNGGPTIASWGPGRLDMFFRSSNNHLFQTTCTTSPCKTAGAWGPWVPLGGFLQSKPAAASPRAVKRIDVVSLSDDGQALPTPNSNRGMWHRYWPWPYADRHVFDAGDDRGNPEAGSWTGSFYKADCSAAYRTMMVGLSATPGSARAHSQLCGSEVQVQSATQNVIEFRTGSFRSDGAGHTIAWGSATDWDVGFFKGQCAVDEAVTGISQETGGRLASIRCSKMPSGMSLGAACETRVFAQGDNRGSQLADDWAFGYYKGQCAAGEAVAGVSAYTSQNGSIIAGAAHAIRCCGISP